MPYIEPRCGRTARRGCRRPCPSVCSRSSSTTPGYFASLCGKSDAQMNRSAPIRRPSTGAVRSPGSKLIQHWRWKYSLGVSDSGAACPAVALEELVEPVHPVRDPTAAALEHATFSSGDARARRRTSRFDSVICWSMSRISAWCVPGAISWPIARDAPGMSARPADVQPDRQPGLLERLPHRRVRADGGTAGRCTRSDARTRPRARGRAMRRASSAARLGILQRQRADAHRAGRALRRTTRRASRCRPRTTRPASSGSWMRAELQAEAGIHHRDVDALGVEHLHALVRVEAGGVQVFVVAAAAEVVERSPALPRPTRPRSVAIAVLDQALVVARVARSSAGGCPGRQGAPEGPRVHRSGRLAEVAVGVDDQIALRDRFNRGFAHTSHHGFLPVEEQHTHTHTPVSPA